MGNSLRKNACCCGMKKLYVVVMRSRFASQKAKAASRPKHFWKLKCRKSACGRGARHMPKPKCTKQEKPTDPDTVTSNTFVNKLFQRLVNVSPVTVPV